MANVRPVVESRIRNRTAAGSWLAFCHVSDQDPSPAEYENETRKGARSNTTGSVMFSWLVETSLSPNGAYGVLVRTNATPLRSTASAIRTTSRPGSVLGPTADRTSVTADAEPSNSGILVARFGVMNSAADRSAASRFNATVNSSLRWTRMNPRYQLGSHWAVMAPMAAKIIPIKVVATSASRRVNPATSDRLCR